MAGGRSVHFMRRTPPSGGRASRPRASTSPAQVRAGLRNRGAYRRNDPPNDRVYRRNRRTGERIATAAWKIACVARLPDGTMKSADIPADVAERLDAAPTLQRPDSNLRMSRPRRRRHRRRPGGQHRLDPARPAGLPRRAVRARAVSRASTSASRSSPRPTGCCKRLNMLDKMKASHFVKKYSVQFVNASGKLSAPFYFHDNKPHECSQTWQVVRSEFDQMMLDNAREHGVEVHEGVRVLEVLFEGDRAVGVRDPGRGRHAAARCGPRSSSTPAARARCCRTASSCAQWDPVLNKGAIWTYWEGAYRDTGRDEGATLVIQTPNKQGWFWYIPLHDDIVSVGVVGAVRLPVQGPRQPRADLQRGGRALPGRQGARSRTRTRVDRLLRHQGLFVSLDAGGRRRLGAGRRRLRLPRSALLVRRAAGAASRASWPPTPSPRGWRRATRRRPSSASGAPMFNQGVDRMRRLVCEYYDGFSFGKFVRTLSRTCKGTVTDLLIGDLFTDRVDEVWGPMESLYPPDKKPIPAWDAGAPVEGARTRSTSCSCRPISAAACSQPKSSCPSSVVRRSPISRSRTRRASTSCARRSCRRRSPAWRRPRRRAG